MAQEATGQPTEQEQQAGQAAAAGEPQVAPKPAEGDEGKPTQPPETPQVPDKFEFGAEQRATTREIHRTTRELARVQQALKDRQAELSEAGKRLAASVPKPREPEADEEGLVEHRGMRLPREGAEYLRSIEATNTSLREQIGAFGSRLDTLESADTAAEEQDHRDQMESQFRSLCTAARGQMMPNLSDRAARRADKAIWSEFEDQFGEFLDGSEDPSALTDEKLAGVITKSVLEVRQDYSDMGYQQLAKNREAAAAQPPSVGGQPAAPAPPDYKTMTPEQRRKAEDEAGLTGGHLKFDRTR